MIFHIYANQSNIGDWVSAKGIQSTLAGLEIRELFCDGPWIDQTVQTVAQLGPDDLVIIGGGGLLMDYFDRLWIGLAALERLPRLVVWGVGLCDHKQQASTGLMPAIREVFKKASLVSVRDGLTRDAVGRDLAPKPMLCSAVVSVGPEPIRRRGVLHVDNYDVVGGELFESMNQACKDFADQTGRGFDRTNNRIERGRDDKLEACLDRYRAADVVVSSGLHGCIIAAAMGRKVLAVSGDRKVEGFMGAIGLVDWCLDFREADRLPRMLGEIEAQPSVAERVAEARSENMAFGRAVLALYNRQPI